jgi:Uma2 family endonuclease
MYDDGVESENVMQHGAEDRRLTYEDFLLFPDDGMRHEIIDGEHYVTPSPNGIHQTIVGNLHFALREYLRAHPMGQVFFAPFDVIMSQFDVVEPDLLYISNERRRGLLTRQHVRGAPDLVVEVGSPGTRRRDETLKRRLYERAGVLEYWFVDPDPRLVRVYRRERDRFTPTMELSQELAGSLRSPLFPNLELPLTTVFDVPSDL